MQGSNLSIPTENTNGQNGHGDTHLQVFEASVPGHLGKESKGAIWKRASLGGHQKSVGIHVHQPRWRWFPIEVQSHENSTRLLGHLRMATAVPLSEAHTNWRRPS